MIDRYLAAAIQFEPRLGAKEENVARLCALVEETARAGARVIVMPEMAVTGYCFRDRAEIAPLVETVPGPTTETFAAIATRHGCYIAVGLAERDPHTDLYYNTSALVGPQGLVASYRKSHAFISEPRWAAECTNLPPVVETEFGRLGMLICMDADYVEPARLLGVQGCDVALFPTCWLDDKAPAQAWMTRAYENGMYFIAADRYGLEREVQFSGGSCVLDPDGAVVSMQDTGDGIIYGEIDLNRTRTRPFTSGTSGDKLADRRPAEYATMAQHTYQWNPLEFHRLYGERTFAQGGRLRVAAIQYAASPECEELRTLASAAARDGAGLIVLPELPFLERLPLSADEAAAAAETLDGPTAERLVALARDLDTYIVGSLIERALEASGDHLYLTALLAGPNGMVGHYRTVHPDRAVHAWAAPGNLGLPTFDLPTARIGLMLGRDALLPEPARVLALGGADIICAPAALHGPSPRAMPASAVPFAEPRLRAANSRHFHLWRQRASENNTVVAFANRAAPLGMGHSGVFGPEAGGTESIVGVEGSGIAALDIDTTSLSDRVPTAPVRIKELLRKRVPAMYAPLVTPQLY